MCLNVVTRIREELLPGYQSISRNSEFSEYFIPYRDHPYYYWNVQIYTSLGHSLLVSTNNENCVKSSIATQACKVVRTYTHEILGWKIISRLLHSCATHLGGMNGDIQYDLATLAFNNGEQLEDFHRIILRLQQEIILFGETAYPNRLLFQYTKAL